MVLEQVVREVRGSLSDLEGRAPGPGAAMAMNT